MTGAHLQALGPRERRADFHCVTTWSVTGLVWTGVPLRDVLASVGITDAPAPYLVARGADRGRAVLCWADAVAENVLLATRLGGAALDDRHGGPLRLVSPGQYGYKSIKHLVAIDLRTARPRLPGKEHVRARVDRQERHPRLPARLVAPCYRLLIPVTAYVGERTLRRHRARRPGDARYPAS